MASIKNLKKDINYILGDLIDETTTKNDKETSEKIIDEIILTFDELVAKINQKNVENKKAHFKAIQNDIAQKYEEISAKING